jgi:hypothetical protein
MRTWLMPLVAFLLVGCQPPAPLVIAMMEAGKLTFHIRHRGLITDRIFGWDDDQESAHGLSVTNGKGMVLLFAKDGRSDRHCEASETFPVTLDEIRCGFRWTKGQALTASNDIYEIYLNACVGLPDTCGGEHWTGYPVGRFRLNKDGSVDNIRPD